ncbi:hypothetical protein ACJRO7_001246 [Eucalyptus globulus]|uniref:HMA domain-containing protein n=1 Tax=Eucalyptus globulus TaxID=34317 RepID=A0ABD3LTJ3_EUCGL
MGEQKEGPKNEGEKKDDGNGAAVVLKMDMHCRGCAKKIRQAVKKSGGVEDVKVDFASNKLTVTGKVEPAKIKDALETMTKKKVEIVSPLPKKDGGGGGDKKPEEKTEKKPEKKTEEKKTEEKKAEDKKAEDKKPKETTVVFKIRTHCDGCIRKMNKIISRIEGVNAVSIDGAKDLVTVTGTADPKEMISYLREKLTRSVEVVPPPAAKKDDGASDKKDKEGGGGEKKDKQVGGGGDKKEKEAAAGGGEKKDGGGEKKGKGESEKEDGGGSEAPKMELSKMEYGGHSAPPPMYWSEGTSYAQSYAHNYAPTQSYPHNYAHNYAMEPYNYQAGYANQGYPNHYAHEGYPNHYTNEGYGMPMDHRLHPMDPRLNPPQMFSDENPNACSVM